MMKFWMYLSVLLLCSVTLIFATCPPSTPQTNQCGPNTPCADGTCCGANGFCGMTPGLCGCGCQNGPCLIPSIIMFRPTSVMNLTLGVNWTVTVEITTPVNARVIVDVVQQTTNIVVATVQDTVLTYSETLFIQFAPLWKVTTLSGVAAFYYRLSLIDLNVYNADPINSWQTPMDSSIIQGVTIAAAIQTTTSPPTTKTNSTRPTNGTTSPPTIPPSIILDPSGNPVTRVCPIVGIDTQHICQGCGYTLCQGSMAAYSSCPTGSTCNPNTNTCDPTLYCINNVVSFQAPATTSPPVAKTVNHGSIISSSISLVMGLIIGVMMI